MERLAIGIDLGGTKVEAALINRQGEIIASQKGATHAELGPDRIIENLEKTIRELLASVHAGWESIEGAGIGVPGSVEPGTGTVLFAPNLGWKDVPVARILSDRWKNLVYVNNDANLAALGEGWMGAGKGVSHLALFTLGTGVGGGILLDGKLYEGAWGAAGEFGHIPIKTEGIPCTCGSHDCLELYASAKFLHREVAVRRDLGEKSLIFADETLLKENVGNVIYDAAKRNDPVALRIFAEFGRNLGIGISAVADVLNPQRVLIGGGISKGWDFFQQSMKAEVALRTFPTIRKGLEILPAQLGDHAGIMGAAALIFGGSHGER